MSQINTLSKWVCDLRVGLAKSFYNLGIKYEGVDDTRAYKWYLRSAKLGCISAQSQVGTHLLFGIGVAQDPEEGGRWLIKATEKDCEHACFRMAQYHFEFKGDSTQSLWWYEKAADMKYAPAFMMIGEFNEFGLGVEVNFEIAKMYYQLAIDCVLESSERRAKKGKPPVILTDYIDRTNEALNRINYNIEWGRENNRTDAQVIAAMNSYFEEKSREEQSAEEVSAQVNTNAAGHAMDVETYQKTKDQADNKSQPTIH